MDHLCQNESFQYGPLLGVSNRAGKKVKRLALVLSVLASRLQDMT